MLSTTSSAPGPSTFPQILPHPPTPSSPDNTSTPYEPHNITRPRSHSLPPLFCSHHPRQTCRPRLQYTVTLSVSVTNIPHLRTRIDPPNKPNHNIISPASSVDAAGVNPKDKETHEFGDDISNISNITQRKPRGRIPATPTLAQNGATAEDGTTMTIKTVQNGAVTDGPNTYGQQIPPEPAKKDAPRSFFHPSVSATLGVGVLSPSGEDPVWACLVAAEEGRVGILEEGFLPDDGIIQRASGMEMMEVVEVRAMGGIFEGDGDGDDEEEVFMREWGLYEKFARF